MFYLLRHCKGTKSQEHVRYNVVTVHVKTSENFRSYKQSLTFRE